MRLDPEVRHKLQEAAKQAERSFPADLEARIVATCDLDHQGVELLRAIASEIALIQKMTSSRWHRKLKAWAAVAEMLRLGPIHDFNPDQPQNDDHVITAFKTLEAVERDRSELVDRLADMGIAARQDPDKPPVGEAGIARLPDPTRSSTRLLCQKLDDEAQQAQALALLEEIIQLDAQVRKAHAAFNGALRPYLDETNAGRKIYRDYLRKEAARKRSLGEPYNILHLTEVEP
ncbi:hypothetical protein [Novosphingobium aerophilum]|uniref:Uncharacterized protein n=1 Tax=Novosphingobium aerophilum TaxID=2839843 RepID=A0A7X1FAM1_9SPHN|nr:hypothetical protein [Novosphingobium aerophilum]MBC2653457.1 hypothetical protein [Novosphingobium aerophilum]